MAAEIGRITSVLPAPEDNRIYVSVRVSPDEFYEEIPFASGKTGLWMVPEEGDIVEVYEIGFETYVARTPHNPSVTSMPTLSEGDFSLRLNEDTELTFQKQGDGTYNLSLKADGDVTIETDSDSTININGGNVVIGEEANAVSVAVQDHTHDVSYSWSDPGGSSTATTGTPNEPGTDTIVE